MSIQGRTGAERKQRVFHCGRGLVWMEEADRTLWDQINFAVNRLYILTVKAV